MGPDTTSPHVVIVGGGFGGLETAKTLRGAPVRITLVDRSNHHLFQPLLYQVAAAILSPEEIASPIRRILRAQANADIVMAVVDSVAVEQRQVRLAGGESLTYDFLVLAPGAAHSYFGKNEWSDLAPGLKNLDDALEIRRRILLAFEEAEQEPDPEVRRACLTFVIVGGGPTGVELAGTLKEMARLCLPKDFRHIHTGRARVILVEAGPCVLPSFGEGLSGKALQSLERIGVEVRLGQSVTGIDPRGVQLGYEYIPARTVLWAAGVAASPLGRSLGVPLDRTGRVIVEPDLSIPGHPEVFVIGDLSHFAHGTERPLPGVAPVAIQQGRFVARTTVASLVGNPRGAFRYRNRGSMATIGRRAALAQIGPLQFAGVLAWLAWLFVHLMQLVGFRNRVFVFFDWLWAYATTQHRARLILGGPGPKS